MRAQTVADLETFALGRQLELAVRNRPPDTCTVPLSAEDCKLVLSNLLMNAIQHSPRIRRLSCASPRETAPSKSSIQDHGDGIDPAALPHVFDRFYRGDPSRARATGGAGLGLAICKAAVEKAGGTINLASESDQGTIVSVRLPAPNPHTLPGIKNILKD